MKHSPELPAYLPWLITLFVACGGGGQSDPDASPGATIDASPAVDSAPLTPPVDAAPASVCPDEFIGGGDGCDCGCGVPDPDCPTPLTASDCQHDNCGAGTDPDPNDPLGCVATVVPNGWTCSTFEYGDDGVCTCGCGALDDRDCDTPLGVDDCSKQGHGCPDGFSPDPDDPTLCEPSPSGWTCHFSDYYDNSCHCGCGVPDPGCPASPHVSDCQFDGCDAGEDPDPTALTTCIDDAPQAGWTCDLALLLDGQCDCGCGGVDPDCPPGAGPDSCDAVHCGGIEELKPGTIAECWELCVPTTDPVGTATCTNGGFFSIFSACERHLSACSDGRTYQVECDGGECVCRVNGQCVKHSTGGCSFGFTCGWSLVDNT